ncbi:hypothetical protein [Streptacidiphilus neutrinimicus]|uniref:hypothetical protein n=1 Tax=Streptacidiphilus neutrinimicus TaxID=105420 RepID=UPI000694D913|nr:hypothetical protein [Streptacidiphilus neutrinimicus]
MDRHFLHRQRHQDQEAVDAGERGRVLAELAGGRSLTDVLEGEAAAVGSVPVRELLEALPGVDRIHAGQLMRALNIGERCTTDDLSDSQSERLRQLFLSATAA